jgi:hypothetical protein
VPGSVQTQVTGLNDRGVTVGFSSTMNNANQVNDNAGFVDVRGRFLRVVFPAAANASPPVDQLLGVNNGDIAVGFYTDAAGNNHAYRYDINDRRFRTVTVAGATSATAAAINNDDDVAGFFTNSAGVTDGFLLRDDGHRTVLAFPGATMTQALGVNDHREVVGVYTVGTGANAQTHGFTWTTRMGFVTVDDPSGVGTTTVNGVNDTGALVGFYTDAAGNTDGMLSTPVHPSSVPTTPPTMAPPTTTPQTTTSQSTATTGQSSSSSGRLTLRPMPSGTVSLERNSNGTLTAHVDLTGLTPGSAHETAIDDTDDPSSAVVHVLNFGTVTADATGQVHADITAQNAMGYLPAGSAFTVRLGTYGNDYNRNAVAMEAIARSAPLPAHPSSGTPYDFHAISDSPDGGSNGQLTGAVNYTFDAAAHTLTLNVNATGLSQGAHAAHIHIGSCTAQGAVAYMIPDLQANARGDVINQTRVVTGVSALPAPGSWYLNIHQGDMNSILVNGAPALSFRPLLCANF